MPLNREQFQAAAAKRRKTLDVECAEFGIVRLRSLSAGDVVRFQHEVAQAKAKGESDEEVSFGMLARSWVAEDGELLFPIEQGIIEARSLDPALYTELTRAVLRLNGMSVEAIEESAKN